MVLLFKPESSVREKIRAVNNGDRRAGIQRQAPSRVQDCNHADYFPSILLLPGLQFFCVFLIPDIVGHLHFA